MRIHHFFSSLALICASCVAVCAADFPNARFSIDPIDRAPDGASIRHVAMFFLPAKDAFAANVGVLIFGKHPNLQGFIATTRKEWAENGSKVISEKERDGTEWTVEFTHDAPDPAGGKLPTHYYAKAVYANGQVYFANATCPEAQWKENEAALKQCVDSLHPK
jgi:hypothetical protein